MPAAGSSELGFYKSLLLSHTLSILCAPYQLYRCANPWNRANSSLHFIHTENSTREDRHIKSTRFLNASHVKLSGSRTFASQPRPFVLSIFYGVLSLFSKCCRLCIHGVYEIVVWRCTSIPHFHWYLTTFFRYSRLLAGVRLVLHPIRLSRL